MSSGSAWNCSVLLHSLERTRQALNAFDEAGIEVAIDDFGTGYSSLSYLKSFPVDSLKVDRSFVNDIQTDPDCRALVGAIVTMGRQLGLQVIAEGVETQAQLDHLRSLQSDRYQGYLFSRPLAVAEFGRLIGSAPWAPGD
ncbi:MAG TPA: EAL domain-containing protein [Xanthomonadaceae bacterium]|nr:EAL domain-containing protein [Xanthomonadaceae bacterium]